MKSSPVDAKHLNFIIWIERKLTDLLKVLKVSETISEIDYKKLKEVLVLEFYMAFAKLIKKFLTNV